jgi:hypothetical protein
MLHTRSIEVAGQHAVAWLFGYLCGIRPSSLAPSAAKDGSLLWGDLEFHRQIDADGNWDGEFSFDVTFRDLKGDEKANKNDDDGEEKTLNMTVGLPDCRVILSLPHRLVTILLRREYLRDHNSNESLMEGREYPIAIKQDAKLKPVFFAGAARELSLTDAAARALSFTDYLRLRVQWLGYPANTTFCSGRRKLGTQIGRKLGADKAHTALGHAPELRGVVDTHLQVYGTNNLRIMDAGIFPLVPAAYLQAPVYAIAESVCSLFLPLTFSNRTVRLPTLSRPKI